MSRRLNKAVEMMRTRRRLGPVALKKVVEAIPKLLTDRLTSKELYSVMCALDAHWHKAQRYAEAEILDIGGVWDPAQDRFLSLK